MVERNKNAVNKSSQVVLPPSVPSFKDDRWPQNPALCTKRCTSRHQQKQPSSLERFFDIITLRGYRHLRFPADAHLLAPCTILVTETPGAGGVKTGKITITDPDCDQLFEKEWLISAGTY